MTTHTQAACAGSIISVLFLSAFIYVPTADASRGSSDDRTDERSEEFRESGSDDGTLDQGSGDFGDDSKSDSSDDGTPDQGRGDFDAMGTIIDDSPDRFVMMRSIRGAFKLVTMAPRTRGAAIILLLHRMTKISRGS